jgi:DNA repair protein RecN (Recombination protein N)
MLLELRIENLGIIEQLEIVVERGLSAITGETGAGKTLVVEALELLAGARADAALVRPGTPEARGEGRFVDPTTGEEVVVARAVPADGRSRAYIDGRLATAGELADLGARLIDLHGQHTHQSLLAPAMQRAVLDAYAGAPALDARAEYQAARQVMRDIDLAMGDLGGDERARAREMSLLQYEIEEIDDRGSGTHLTHDGRDGTETARRPRKARSATRRARGTHRRACLVDGAGPSDRCRGEQPGRPGAVRAAGGARPRAAGRARGAGP